MGSLKGLRRDLSGGIFKSGILKSLKPIKSEGSFDIEFIIDSKKTKSDRDLRPISLYINSLF